MSNGSYWYGPTMGFHGGDPQPGDVPATPQQIADHNAMCAAAQATAAQTKLGLSAIMQDPTVQFLLANDPQTCFNQVQLMVTDLPTAKDMMGRFALVLCIVVRELAGTVNNGS